jgi:hypothetical protein
VDKRDILNAALRLLGTDTRIEDLETDTTAEADVARDIYPVTLASALSTYRWTFCREETAQLAQLVDATAEGHYRYQLPAHLALTRLFDAAGNKVTYRLDGTTVVVLDASEEIYAGIIAPVNEGLLPPHFCKALVYQLAGDMAMPITNERTTAEFWLGLAADEWPKAKATDRQGAGHFSVVQESEIVLLSARRG